MWRNLSIGCHLALGALGFGAWGLSACDSQESPAGSGGATAAGGHATAGTSAGGSGPGGSSSVGTRFVDTSARIAILADQLPTLSAAELDFAASHYVGTQKQVVGATHALRTRNPSFVVLHYHLAMWQSAPATLFIVDGQNWSNDYPEVTQHESWFWHNAASARVPSSSDQKLLMNVADSGFRAYWAESIAAQIAAGEYDGVFLDSASPALLQGEAAAGDPRLGGTAVKDTAFAELGNATWIAAWESFIGSLESALSAQGQALIPNTGAFITTWDNTNYGLSAGIFSEGFASPDFATADWKQSTNELLSLGRAGKIVILQNYLSSPDDVGRRMYYLGNYLLVRGSRTYLDYFATSPFEWYPEWDLDLGAAKAPPAASIDALASGGIYRRDFERGAVFVNPTDTPVTVDLGQTLRRVLPSGGGPVSSAGQASGTLSRSDVTSLTVGPRSAEILEV
jgi:hypothetical protein